MIFNVQLGEQNSIFCKLCKNAKKTQKTIKLKKYGHFTVEFSTFKLVKNTMWAFAKI